MTWLNGSGKPLKFQDGDHVRIDVSHNPAHSLPFLTGYVRGYSVSGYAGKESVAYELYRMGHPPLCWVREKFLILVPESLPHKHYPERSCRICGKDGD